MAARSLRRRPENRVPREVPGKSFCPLALYARNPVTDIAGLTVNRWRAASSREKTVAPHSIRWTNLFSDQEGRDSTRSLSGTPFKSAAYEPPLRRGVRMGPQTNPSRTPCRSKDLPLRRLGCCGLQGLDSLLSPDTFHLGPRTSQKAPARGTRNLNRLRHLCPIRKAHGLLAKHRAFLPLEILPPTRSFLGRGGRPNSEARVLASRVSPYRPSISLPVPCLPRTSRSP
jgi:hypothetical protein